MAHATLTAIIMAGGQGTRFWPLSSTSLPKQFLDLEGTGRSLLQTTFDRLLALTGGPDNIFVATVANYRELVQHQLPELGAQQLLLEPSPRDSGPAVALASLQVHRQRGASILGFFPSDHRITDLTAFHQAVRCAQRVAERERGLVTLGIRATHPASAYGYIERGEPIPGGFSVARFVEKPARARAEAFLAQGNFDWNGGIFVWHSDVILAELRQHAPDIIEPLLAASDDHALANVYPSLPRRSIDYALMEHTRRAFVVPTDCGWDDVGDWLAIARLHPHDPAGNVVVGQHLSVDTTDNIIYNDNPNTLIATLGVHDLVIVHHGNRVLVLPKARVTDLKKLLAQLPSD